LRERQREGGESCEKKEKERMRVSKMEWKEGTRERMGERV